MGWIQGAADLFGFGDFWGMLRASAKNAKWSLENGKQFVEASADYMSDVEGYTGDNVGKYIKSSLAEMPKYNVDKNWQKLGADEQMKMAKRLAQRRLRTYNVLGGDFGPKISKADSAFFKEAAGFRADTLNARKQYFRWKSLSGAERLGRWGTPTVGGLGMGYLGYNHFEDHNRY